ncbi:site-2 protease family protein [Catenulispora sp. NF23]|uniref:Zinc metalloprotease n=1 Tax=Catenulispora pinistramenti TaxID=2705254 RepID=A0ABS5KS67_9ACTN|nr:site-2 protease family protein [Catenulispora pinistramenti]MBS2534524.1 site-2 protease family protein [Catenulispora pinistramenti]MBS2548845.1 site-2 protease family protein [Catenulispora pinistramenti]
MAEDEGGQSTGESGENEPGKGGASRVVRGPGLRLGRPFGIPLYVSPSWFVVAAFITVLLAPQSGDATDPSNDFGNELGGWRYVLSLAYAVFLYGSVVVHELAHSALAKRLGLPVRRIVIHFLGGVSEIEKESDSPGKAFWIAFVGPLTSAALAGIGFAVYQVIPHDDSVSLGQKVAATLIFGFWASNLLVAIFNMLPGLPLDGGQLLRAAVWKATGRPMAGTVAAAWAGRVLAIAVFIVMNLIYVHDGTIQPFGLGLAVFMAMFIWYGATQALVVAKLRERIPGLSARKMTRRAISVDARIPLAEALRRAHEVNARGIVLVDGNERPTGLVNEAQVIATPEQRRPWVEAGDVAHPLDPGLIVKADLMGEELLDVLRANPAPEYLVIETSGEIVGVLAASDVQAAFLGKPPGPPPTPRKMPV